MAAGGGQVGGDLSRRRRGGVGLVEEVEDVGLEWRRGGQEEESALGRGMEEKEGGDEGGKGEARGDDHQPAIGIFFEEVRENMFMKLEHFNAKLFAR